MRRSRPGRTSLKAAMMASAAVLAVGAATAEGAQDEELREETVTVYATSNPLPVFDFPGQVTVVDREALETLAPSSISDALRDVPGLDFAGGPRRTGETPSLRGLSGQNVLILLDGARQSFASAHDGRFFVDPELIGTAEVVRGPASSLYGSGAVGGVLAFESVDAGDLLSDDETWGARFRLGYQGVNEEALASLTAFTRQNNFDGLASLGIRHSGDIALGSGADLPSDDEIQTALLKGSYALTDALTIEGSWQRFANTAVEPNNGQGTLGTGDSILDRDVQKDITAETFRFSADFNPVGNDWIDAGLTAYQTTSEVAEFDQTIPRTTIREIETTGLSVRNASRFMVGAFDTTLTMGGDWYKDAQIGIDDQAIDGLRGGVPNGESEFVGLFAQVEAVVETGAGELLLIPGVRFDEFENSSSIAPGEVNSDDAISPRFAASFGPNALPWLRVFGSFSEGFRAPSINELYLDGVHFSVPHPVLFNPAAFQFIFANNNFIPNPDLVPEDTQTFEIGAGVNFSEIFIEDDRLQAKLSFFETEAQDLINLSADLAFDQTCFVPPLFQPCTAGTSESANVAEAQLEGWEGELHYDSDRWFATVSYASIEGTDTSDGSDLGSLTPDRLAFNVGVKIPEWRARIGTRIQMADDFSRREASGMGDFMIVDERAGYVVLDLYASWRPGFADGLRFDAGIDNVLDHDYDRAFAGVSEPGQNIRIAATYQFGN